MIEHHEITAPSGRKAEYTTSGKPDAERVSGLLDLLLDAPDLDSRFIAATSLYTELHAWGGNPLAVAVQRGLSPWITRNAPEE